MSLRYFLTRINIVFVLFAALGMFSAHAAISLEQHQYNGYNPGHSSARNWSEVMIVALRGDDGNVAVNSRNVFHFTAVLYDAWAFYDDKADTFLLGKTVGDYRCALSDRDRRVLRNTTGDRKAARDMAISFAAYRFLSHRYQSSAGAVLTQFRLDNLMAAMGYNANIVSSDYTSGSHAALGNYIAKCMIEFGLQDGSNQQGDYANQYYQPVNSPLDPVLPGIGNTIVEPDRWQNLILSNFVTKTGNIATVPDFQAAEWGWVTPFALSDAQSNIYQRDGYQYRVYLDPGEPVRLRGAGAKPAEYQWTFGLVAAWSSHLDPADGVMWDISPASIGNGGSLPETIEAQRDFYDLDNGGDYSPGHALNPKTGAPYIAQIVPRGDYTRVTVQFWADGPSTAETPSGFFIKILNSVSDEPGFERRFKGQGPVLDDLEWDVKAYFAMGGAMHDAGVTVWSVKGWHDYVRPLSAIRYMCARGQSSDPMISSYDPEGIRLKPGFIELVEAGDPLAGAGDEHVGKIKLNAWRGPDYIANPVTDVAGVGWILCENWWPYQRDNFVTPPFAGYISGHSTLTRAGAEIMTLLTGDQYFPGGLAEFYAAQNQFLAYENGPSVDVRLQFATYHDLADAAGISRLWAGVHPPVDDIAGRRAGRIVAHNAFEKAESYFNGTASSESKGGGLSVWGVLLLGIFATVRRFHRLIIRKRFWQ